MPKKKIEEQVKTRKKTPHLEAADRTNDILAAALRVAERDGYANLRRDAIAVEAGVTGGLVTIRLGTMPNVQRSVMRQAIAKHSLSVLAQGLAQRCPYAQKAPEELRKKAARLLLAA